MPPAGLCLNIDLKLAPECRIDVRLVAHLRWRGIDVQLVGLSTIHEDDGESRNVDGRDVVEPEADVEHLTTLLARNDDTRHQTGIDVQFELRSHVIHQSEVEPPLMGFAQAHDGVLLTGNHLGRVVRKRAERRDDVLIDDHRVHKRAGITLPLLTRTTGVRHGDDFRSRHQGTLT